MDNLHLWAVNNAYRYRFFFQVVLPQTGGSNKAGYRLVYSNTKGDFNLDGVFNVISYDVVPKIKDMLLDLDFKIVIADESHFLKNAQAKRTMHSLPVLQKAKYVVLLSGTPALSRPIELFTQLQALYPTVYKNVNEYGNRYCKGVSTSSIELLYSLSANQL
jgi:SWI/SNF-related matrix-associated actin-dependent regulator 1 of chromatin subfamily A